MTTSFDEHGRLLIGPLIVFPWRWSKMRITLMPRFDRSEDHWAVAWLGFEVARVDTVQA